MTEANQLLQVLEQIRQALSMSAEGIIVLLAVVIAAVLLILFNLVVVPGWKMLKLK